MHYCERREDDNVHHPTVRAAIKNIHLLITLLVIREFQEGEKIPEILWQIQATQKAKDNLFVLYYFSI